jgi:hypothetical protein
MIVTSKTISELTQIRLKIKVVVVGAIGVAGQGKNKSFNMNPVSTERTAGVALG